MGEHYKDTKETDKRKFLTQEGIGYMEMVVEVITLNAYSLYHFKI